MKRKADKVHLSVGSLLHLLFKELSLLCSKDFSLKLEKERVGNHTVWGECCRSDGKALRGGISVLWSCSNRNTMDTVVSKQEVISHSFEGGKSEIRVLASSNSGEDLLAHYRWLTYYIHTQLRAERRSQSSHNL